MRQRTLALTLSALLPFLSPMGAAAQLVAAPALPAPGALAPLALPATLAAPLPSAPGLAAASRPLTALPESPLRVRDMPGGLPASAVLRRPLAEPATLRRTRSEAASLRSALRGPVSQGSAHQAASRPFDGLRASEAAPVYPDSVYAPLTQTQKAEFRARYLDYLRRRDGVPDRETRRFSIREGFFRDIEQRPVRRQGPPAVDQAVFSRNETRTAPEPGLDERTLWALAMAKSNRSERDGVEYALKRVDPRTRKLDDPLSYIEIEEFYHTRILKDALDVVGIEMRMLPPHIMTRAIIRAMVHLPKFLSNILILNAEVAAVTAFKLLTEKGRELFADQPEPLARIETLLGQILVDEVGHVHFVRSRLGPVRLWFARKIMPVFIRGFLKDVPELELLFGKERLKREILKADVDGIAAGYPDRFDPSGTGR